MVEWSLPILKVSGSNPIDYFDNQHLSNIFEKMRHCPVFNKEQLKEGRTMAMETKYEPHFSQTMSFSKKKFKQIYFESKIIAQVCRKD